MSNRCRSITLSHAVTKLADSGEWKEKRTANSLAHAERFLKKTIKYNSIDVSADKDSVYLARTNDLQNIQLCHYRDPSTKSLHGTSKNKDLALIGGVALAAVVGIIWYKKSKAA